MRSAPLLAILLCSCVSSNLSLFDENTDTGVATDTGPSDAPPLDGNVSDDARVRPDAPALVDAAAPDSDMVVDASAPDACTQVDCLSRFDCSFADMSDCDGVCPEGTSTVCERACSSPAACVLAFDTCCGSCDPDPEAVVSRSYTQDTTVREYCEGLGETCPVCMRAYIVATDFVATCDGTCGLHHLDKSCVAGAGSTQCVTVCPAVGIDPFAVNSRELARLRAFYGSVDCEPGTTPARCSAAEECTVGL